MPFFLPQRMILSLMLACGLSWAFLPQAAVGQSGSRQSTPRYAPPSQNSTKSGSTTRGSETRRTTPQGSANRVGSATRDLPLAMRGFCPVCVVEMKQWVRGSSEYSAAYDGKVYYFPEQKQLQMFQAMPEKYAPALGGDCVVEFANTGRRVAGQLDYGMRHNGRVFFMSSAEHKQIFSANPAKYESVDLAAGGQCVVCQMEMNQAMPGRADVTAVHHGMRYLFAGSEQRKMFLANPEKYRSAAPANGASQGSGSSSRGSSTQGSGRSR